MQMRRGFTPIEVLTCAAIAALASGVAYIAAEPMRETGREKTCAGNLHQIYTGLLLYANDNQGPEELPGLGQIKLVPHVASMLKYVPNKSVFFCPNTPKRAPKGVQYFSTYELNFISVRSGEKLQVQNFVKTFKYDLANLGPKMPLVICNMHDETYYGPREQDIDPDLAQPFQLRLQLNGNVSAQRYVAKRHQSYTLQ